MIRTVSLVPALLVSFVFLAFAVVNADEGKSSEAAAPRVAKSSPKSSQPPKTAPQTSRPSQPQPLLNPEMRSRIGNIRETLAIYSQQHQNTYQHSPWEIMHSIIAFGVDTKLWVGGPGGEKTTAIGWLCYNRRGNGLNLFYTTPDGLGALNGPGLQGHSGQFLAMMAQSKVKEDYPLKVGGRDFTIGDLLAYEKRTCVARTELTFKLIGIVHYEGTDAEWTSQDGQSWSVERLVKEELAQPIRGATCGGTHRLMGLSYTLYKRAKEEKTVTGQLVRADKFTKDYRRYAFSMQNRDGSLSTEWFRGPGQSRDIARRMQTTGHILEWLIFSMPEQQLYDPRTLAAVDYLTTILYQGKHRNWKVGPLGHALHALALYDRRVSRPISTPSPPSIAKSTGAKSKKTTK